MIQTRTARPRWAALGLLLLASSALATPQASGERRPMPDTTWGIHVFNDQTTAWTPELVEFTATRYAGTQKQTRSQADALRAIEPGFIILHYRLGMGLGYRVTNSICVPSGDWFYIIDNQWVQEWPGDQVVQDDWIHHYLGQEVLYCPLGWYLMELDHPDFRQWWSAQVMSQMTNNDNDGLFADSFMVPSFLASQEWSPSLPGLDLVFEALWTQKLESFMAYLRQRFGDQYYLIPNIGYWTTTRDEVDFSIADGVFIEYFATEPYINWGFQGWAAQANRLLDLIDRGRIVIGQTYAVHSAHQRMFSVATYLLLKGDRTYINLEQSMAPEWFPEYDLPIGAPTHAGKTVAELQDPVSGIYRRAFTNGLVLVNPTAQTRAIVLSEPMELAQPTGGGAVPSDGVLPATWRIDYQTVQQVSLAPGRAAVLVHDPAGGAGHSLDANHFTAGQTAHLTITGATPDQPQHVFFTRTGLGSTPFPALGLLLSLDAPRQVGVVTANASGTAVWSIAIPPQYNGIHLWMQAAQLGSATNVIQRTVR